MDEGLNFARWLLSFLPSDWQTVLGLPLLVVLLLVGLVVVIRLFPVFDRVVGPLGAGVASALGMLVLLPEYLVTIALRRSGRRPPAILHTYGDGIHNAVLMGHRVAKAGLAGFTRERRTRRLVILVALVAILFVGNAQSCPAGAAGCTRPVSAWWTRTTAMFGATPPVVVSPTKPAAPKPKPRPTAKHHG